MLVKHFDRGSAVCELATVLKTDAGRPTALCCAMHEVPNRSVKAMQQHGPPYLGVAQHHLNAAGNGHCSAGVLLANLDEDT
jgi:hypothetical protein